MPKKNLQLLMALVVGAGIATLAIAQGTQSDGVNTNGARARDPYTDGAKVGKADPYTDGANSAKFDPYTSGAKQSTRNNLNATSHTRDPYTDGAKTGKADSYTDGAKRP